MFRNQQFPRPVASQTRSRPGDGAIFGSGSPRFPLTAFRSIRFSSGHLAATEAPGRFGASMWVELVNDGPVTIVLTDEPAP